MLVRRLTNEIKEVPSGKACRVRVLFGPRAGHEAPLPLRGAVVGSGGDCDVVLADDACSPRHVTILPTRSGFDLADAGSAGGTWVDGVAVARASVAPGTTLRVGGSLLQLLPAEDCIGVAPAGSAGLGALVGGSVPMRRLYALLGRAAAAETPVLVTGERGTGKDLAARALHLESRRREHSFVMVDCSASNEALIEAELFGQSATQESLGALARADGGTLLLDEVADLPIPLQAKLMRWFESGQATPVGGRRSFRYDVRVVASTQKDLAAEVGRGTFRGDLYYRLCPIEAALPPLRSRAEDIPDLVKLFLERSGFHGAVTRGKNLERLLSHAWPGNVRELRNVVTRAVALAPSSARFDDLPFFVHGAADAGAIPVGRADVPYRDAKSALISRFDREYLADLLRRANSNISQAARLAGLERKYLYRVLERAEMAPARARALT
jgi:DNA-binding NtrC family response regulator